MRIGRPTASSCQTRSDRSDRARRSWRATGLRGLRDRPRRALLRFAYLLCGDRHLAEDLVQEALARTHRRWERIEADEPDAYVRAAIVRAHLSWWRRRSSRERVTADPPDRDGPRPDFADVHAVRDQLWRLLAGLPRAQRAVLVLRYFEDLDDHRIAAVLGCAPGTVRVHASRGLAAMRAALPASYALNGDPR